VSDEVLIDVADRIATITLNRPKARNALNSAISYALPAAVFECDANDDVDVMIITGADPAFCAGVDLKEFGSGGSLSPDAVDPAGRIHAGRRDENGQLPFRGPIPNASKLIIGAINGATIAGGFELALACDFLVASERAVFADTHARVGVMPGWGLTVMLMQAVGLRKARELSATGNFLTASNALQLGLVNHVVPHEDLLPFTRALAQDAVQNDQRAVRTLLATYDEIADATIREAWDIETRVSIEWEGEGFDPAVIEARRLGIVARGRDQLEGGAGGS
jgi:enoyl-CoA hydratase